ncbi:MAG: hypothetical protein ACJ72O_17550, partial [Marmoricola sp.]
MRTFRIVLAGALAALGLSIISAAPAGAATPAALATFAQCQNQVSQTSCSGWTNGGLNQSNHYAEDMVVPQRATFTTTPGTDYVFSVTYDEISGTKHGYDFLATWNKSVTGASACLGLPASNCSGTPTTLNMASDPTVENGSSVASHELPQSDRQWTLYGGTLVSTTTPTHSGNQATTTVTFH